MTSIITKFFQGFSKDNNKKVSYEEARELVQHKDADVRRELAERDDVKAEILYYLASDDVPEVRHAVATNAATPSHADLILASDDDTEVRVGLAEKIALLAPGLTADEQDTVRRITYEALETLARDQITRVRQILSETLKDVADAPPEVIYRLACDAELVVSGPVLEFSPVLTVDEILEIIASEPVSGALSAISSRHDLGESLTDAIAATGDVDAVSKLLGNDSAQIREETLNGLIDKAIDIDQWQDPLTRRPQLPPGAAGRLARFVASNLLDNLTARHDLDPETADEVRSVVEKRLAEEPSTGISADKMMQVQELKKNGALSPDVINEALQSNDLDFCTAALIVLSGLDEAVVLKTVATRNAKGIIAIGWKAGQPPWIVEQLQLRLCKIPVADVLQPSGDEKYPLTKDEMNWQLDFLGDLSS
ncbi:MAG: DUF2336 domain-containing protein [Rhodospirillaceae bacterium]|jgi:uncharacterized protein (DUF2336 family)|nr:DUF2336 domain-containing protein [Rhodospirillaceae bacterium]MBT5013582.1 DUF2336 domain-containing protein [Rhodospirillaceae bacterium]MBT5308902.1 DUF2336 domain-containing protein [Rhodospirillaceae bacterium]MBT6407758.1 DUF2336 domain-containing protein [Rhodospirillaceae bacterium]MBT7355452.1 DUF2336 domain-containing protein [Rhodospirillaceae bacterium]